MTPGTRGRALRMLILLLPLAAPLAACGSSTGPAEPFDMGEVDFAAALEVSLEQMEHLGDQLYIQDRTVGDGAEAAVGDSVRVHYTGWLADGAKFDSSHDRGEPSTFQLATGEVIPGWVRGVPGMQEGGVRLLVIPPALGYGSREVGPIPPNSVLVFEVELLGIVAEGT